MWCGSKPYLAWVYCWFLNAASRGFSPDTAVFSFSSKTNMFKLNMSLIRWGHLRGQERNDTEEREISAGLRCVFYHACTGVSLTTSNGLVTCDTTYWTGLHENNCGLRNFQHAVSIGHVNSTLTLTGFENHPVSMTDVVGGYIKVSGTGRGLSLPFKHALINYSWIIQKRRERSRKSGNA